jgi:signal transduction histidine kinase/CheY-like chemotaxis protein
MKQKSINLIVYAMLFVIVMSLLYNADALRSRFHTDNTISQRKMELANLITEAKDYEKDLDSLAAKFLHTQDEVYFNRYVDKTLQQNSRMDRLWLSAIRELNLNTEEIRMVGTLQRNFEEVMGMRRNQMAPVVMQSLSEETWRAFLQDTYKLEADTQKLFDEDLEGPKDFYEWEMSYEVLEEQREKWLESLNLFSFTVNRRLDIEKQIFDKEITRFFASNVINASVIVLSIAIILAFFNIQLVDPLVSYSKHLMDNKGPRKIQLKPKGSHEVRMLMEHLNQYADKLLSSEDLQIKQFKAIPIPTYTWKREGKDFVLVNYSEAVMTDYGFDKADLEGIMASQYYEGEPMVLGYLNKCVNKQMELEMEATLRHLGSKGKKHFAMKFVHILDDMVILHEYDLTERKVTENMLVSAMKEADRANTAKSEFLANMSHEIRTPLNAVIGFSEILGNIVREEKEKKYITSINTAGKTLLSLINDVLDLSKIEAGMIEIHYVPTSLKSLFHELDILFKTKIQEQGVEFFLEMDPALEQTILIDELRLRQVLINILGNATKFTHEGSIHLKAEVFEEENQLRDLDFGSNLNIKISITDTGVGIKKEEQNKIFDPFKQQSGQNVAKYGGTGLGLSISRKLVGLMGGELILDSEYGKGSCFSVVLKNVEISHEMVLGKEEIEIKEVRFKKKKILVVDDVESNRMVFKELLEMVGMEVILATNGQELLEVAQKEQPDYILSDIRMPVMDGITAIGILKRTEGISHIPVIAVTASLIELNKVNYLEQGFRGFWPKPITYKDVVKEMTLLLGSEGIEESQMISEPNLLGEDPKDQSQRFSSLKKETQEEIAEKILPMIEKNKGPMRKSEMKKLTVLLTEISQENDLNEFKDMAMKLEKHVEAYDIQEISKDLKSLENTMERVLQKEAIL